MCVSIVERVVRRDNGKVVAMRPSKADKANGPRSVGVDDIEPNGTKTLKVNKKRRNSQRVVGSKPKLTRNKPMNVGVFVSLARMIAGVDVDRVPKNAEFFGE